MFRQQTVGRRLYLVVCLFGASGSLVASLWGRNDKCLSSTVRARPTVLSISNVSIRRLEQKQRCDVNVNHVNQ